MSDYKRDVVTPKDAVVEKTELLVRMHLRVFHHPLFLSQNKTVIIIAFEHI